MTQRELEERARLVESQIEGLSYEDALAVLMHVAFHKWSKTWNKPRPLDI